MGRQRENERMWGIGRNGSTWNGKEKTRDESEFKQRMELQRVYREGRSEINVNSDNIGGGRMNVREGLSTGEIVCRGER